jgi:hypothetical protein
VWYFAISVSTGVITVVGWVLTEFVVGGCNYYLSKFSSNENAVHNALCLETANKSVLE